MVPSEFLERATALDMVYLIARNRVEPIDGARRLEYYFANLMCQIANIVRSKGSRPPKIKDFVIEWWRQKVMTTREFFDSFSAFVRYHNKQVEKAEAEKRKAGSV